MASYMQECARYLETLKSYETKPADLIQGRAEEDYMSKLNAAFTTVRGVNKTDVLTLAGAFKTAAGVMRADMQELSALPGIGPTKVCMSPGSHMVYMPSQTLSPGVIKTLGSGTAAGDVPQDPVKGPLKSR